MWPTIMDCSSELALQCRDAGNPCTNILSLCFAKDNRLLWYASQLLDTFPLSKYHGYLLCDPFDKM